MFLHGLQEYELLHVPCQLEYCQNSKMLKHMRAVPHANLVRGFKKDSGGSQKDLISQKQNYNP